jgi:hypothetical protein
MNLFIMETADEDKEEQHDEPSAPGKRKGF